MVTGSIWEERLEEAEEEAKSIPGKGNQSTETLSMGEREGVRLEQKGRG
jgi:hypothetical protein